MEPRELIESAYRLHGPRVLAYLQSRVADLNEAEELLQEVFVIIARNPDALERADSQAAWLIGIARNLALEHSRRKKMGQSDALESLPTREVSDTEELNAMRMAIEGLAEAQREVLELRLRDELSYAEIAETLGIPVGTVRSRIHHAVRSLRESLERTSAKVIRDERLRHG